MNMNIVADKTLSAIANRVAQDIHWNKTGTGIEQFLAGDLSPDSYVFANGQTPQDVFGDAYSDGTDIYLLPSYGSRFDDAFADMTTAPTGLNLLDQGNWATVGIGEYGGVWVVVTNNIPSDDPATYKQLRPWKIDRFPVFAGTEDDDLMIGSSGHNFMYGYGGDDRLFGGMGADRIYGGDGDDTFRSVVGNDTPYQGDGEDKMYGGAGDDVFYSVSNSERDRDQSFGGDGFDTFYGSVGVDRFNGGLNADVAYGGDGNDILKGGGGHDIIYGGNSERGDALRGHTGRDQLYAGTGDDVLWGGSGRDILSGGMGNDIMVGGRDADQFVFNSIDESGAVMQARDQIRDFDADEGDIIDLTAIDAKTGDGNQSFDFIGDAAFSSTAGELRYNANSAGIVLQADHDGDGVQDFAIMLRNVDSITQDALLL